MSEGAMHIAKVVASFVFALVAAYAFSFAADMLFGRLFGGFPDTVWVPIATWSIIAVVLAYLGAALSKARVATVVPWVIIGVIALIGSIFGSYVHSYIVAAAVLLVAVWRFWACSPSRHGAAS